MSHLNLYQFDSCTDVWWGFSLLIIQTGQLLARWSSTRQGAVASETHFDAY